MQDPDIIIFLCRHWPRFTEARGAPGCRACNETTRDDSSVSHELVFRFFTEPALLERWLCVQAQIDAHPRR